MRSRTMLGMALAISAASATALPVQGGSRQAFAGRMLVVASDGDMQASAYQGDRLGPQAPDVLSVVQLGGASAGGRPATVKASNSVVGPPSALALSPDGRYALVAETRGRNERGPDARLADLPAGRLLTVIDLRAPERPRVVQRLLGLENPLSVSVSPNGRTVAVAYAGDHGSPLVLYRFDGGRLTRPQTPVVPGFGAGDAMKGAAYHPSGALALVYARRPRLSFVRATEADGPTRLTLWGDDVPLGPTPFEVRFTHDGRFGLVNDMTASTTGPAGGHVSSIAVAQSFGPGGDPRHVVVSTVRTGVLPEGLAISPDGRWAVTTNLEGTAYRSDDPRQSGFASLSLLRIDPASGRLTSLGEHRFNGVIPEGAAFDNTSRELAVICFDHLTGRAKGGSIDFWRLRLDQRNSSKAVLTPTSASTPVARGAQSLEIVRW